MNISVDQVKAIFFIIALTVVLGVFDSQGFIHASKVWQMDEVYPKSWDSTGYWFAQLNNSGKS